MPTPDQLAYARKLDEVVKRYVAMQDRTIKDMVSALQDLRSRIGVTLVDAGGFEAYRFRQMQDSVDRLVGEFDARLRANMRDSMGQAYELGGHAMADPLEVVNIEGAFYQVNAAQLNAVRDFSADLVQNISADLRGQINTQLRLAMLGEQGPFKAMQSITQALGVKSTDLRWGRLKRPQVVKGVAARAEAILRTEMTRAYNIGHFSQGQDMAQRTPGLLKRWIATGDGRTRRSHLYAHIETASRPIPYNEPFQVGMAELMYPGDPRGPAEETVYCRCRIQTIYVELGVAQTPGDSAVVAERRRRLEREKQKKAA